MRIQQLLNAQYTDYTMNLTDSAGLLVILVPELVHLQYLVCLYSTLQPCPQLSTRHLPAEYQCPGVCSHGEMHDIVKY